MPVSESESDYDRISREIEQLKATADIGDNIKVVVNFLSVNREDRLAVDSLWRYADRSVTVANRPGVYARSGLQIGVAVDNFSARLDVAKEQLKSSEKSEIFLVLADGSTGYINVGKEIAVPRFYYSGRWYSAVEYDFRSAGRLLEVSVRKLPSGLIDMELTPVFSDFLDNGGNLRLTELATRVTIMPGQTVVVGGSDHTQDTVAAALFSYRKTAQQGETLITVTPYTN